jgi:DNA invertase Pin-like site-specific DNA recombinase
MAKRMREKLHLGYVRVSTEEQAESGLSLESQEAKVRAHAFACDRNLADVYKDEASAKNLERPHMQTMLRLIAEGRVASLTVAKLDRLTRSVRDLAELLELVKKQNVALVSVGESLDTSTAAGRMVVHMLGVVAQWEREVISERTIAALSVLKGRGVKLGTPKNMTQAARAKGAAANRAKAEAERNTLLPKVLALRESGSSIRAIADELHISPTSVQRILRTPEQVLPFRVVA